MDELAKHKGKTVLLGVRSSFFFVGPCEEALADMPLLGIMARCCVPLMAHKDVTKFLKHGLDDSIGKRKVIKSYDRYPEYRCDERVIIVDGREFGSFWARDEYLAGRKALVAAIESASGKRQATWRKSASV